MREEVVLVIPCKSLYTCTMSDEKPTPLFREEAIRHRTRALFGDVVLATPPATWLITGLLMVIIVGVIAFGVLGSVQIDGENMPVWRWIFGPNSMVPA